MPRLEVRLDKVRSLYFRWTRPWGFWGRNVRIGRGVVFSGDTRRVFLHDRSEILDFSRVFVVGKAASVTLMENASVGYFNVVNVHRAFSLGRNSMCGPFVSFNDNNHAVVGRKPIRCEGYEEGAIRVEDDVWIGTGARILKGVTIGEGAVVGANAVVSRDVPPFAVAMGVPARVTRVRLEEEHDR